MAKDWVLIRGIVSEEFHWWDFPLQLQEQFSQAKIHTADILGNGKTYKGWTPLSIKKNIAHLKNQVPTGNKKIILGFSLGAMLGLEWAYLHPEEVAAVVIINTSLNNSPLQQRLQPKALKKIFKASLEKDYLKREKIILSLTTGLPENKVQEIAPIWAERGLLYPASPKNFFLQLALASQIKQRHLPPQAPLLILNSKNDGVVHPECSQLIAKNWNLKVTTHPSAGHDLTLEDPAWVIQQISNWLTENSLIKNQDLPLMDQSQQKQEQPLQPQ